MGSIYLVGLKSDTSQRIWTAGMKDRWLAGNAMPTILAYNNNSINDVNQSKSWNSVKSNSQLVLNRQVNEPQPNQHHHHITGAQVDETHFYA